MATKSELSPMARREPTSVEYQIHQVVSTFQIMKASQAYQNIPPLFRSPSFCCRKNKGTKAKKIRKSNPLSGQENANNNPDSMESSKLTKGRMAEASIAGEVTKKGQPESALSFQHVFIRYAAYRKNPISLSSIPFHGDNPNVPFLGSAKAACVPCWPISTIVRHEPLE